MAIYLKNLIIKQKYKNTNPKLEEILNKLDHNNILCQEMKTLICSFKFCLLKNDLIKLKDDISKFNNIYKILKVINDFIKSKCKNNFLKISFDLHLSDYSIIVKNNSVYLFNEQSSDFSDNDLEEQISVEKTNFHSLYVY